jgi:hypothetical protein
MLKIGIDPRSDLHDVRLRDLYDYWSARREGRRWPARRDIDPVEFRYLLGNVILVDVRHDPVRFRVRLHGDKLARLAGYDLTGKLLDELPVREHREFAIARCGALVASGEPAVSQHECLLIDRPRQYEALWLPFSEDGERVTMLLGALVYNERGGVMLDVC